jgi:methylaspartate mutase epsilon subunit
MVAKAGGATKTINKTHQEAFGVPTLDANVSGILLSKAANSWILDLVDVAGERVDEEIDWLLDEVSALLEPVLCGPDLLQSVCAGFAAGHLDVPFSASRHARALVVPMRSRDGTIRIFDFGQLPMPERIRRRHLKQLADVTEGDVFNKLEADIMWFCRSSAAGHDEVSGTAPENPPIALRQLNEA